MFKVYESSKPSKQTKNKVIMAKKPEKSAPNFLYFNRLQFFCRHSVNVQNFSYPKERQID